MRNVSYNVRQSSSTVPSWLAKLKKWPTVISDKSNKQEVNGSKEVGGNLPRRSSCEIKCPDGSSMKHMTENNRKTTGETNTTGLVDLLVYLPNGQVTNMTVEYRTPMLDLLVKICTRNNLQLSEYTLQPLDAESPSDYQEKTCKYKPNTIVGLLGTQYVKVVPKLRNTPKSTVLNPQTIVKPFENTFRLKVHLPRNQLYVTRVSQNVYLYDVMKEVCDEKKLDIAKYVFRHPAKSDETLDLNLKIGDYQLTEVYLVSSDDISKKVENNSNYTNGKISNGVFHSIPRKARYVNGDSASLMQQRFCTSYTNLYNRSLENKLAAKKKRPAPVPPKQMNGTAQYCNGSASFAEEEERPRNENGFPSCHSRNSSDSSGYHEASLLSDHCITPPLLQGKNEVINDPMGSMRRDQHRPINGVRRDFSGTMDCRTINGSSSRRDSFGPSGCDQDYNNLRFSPVHASKSVPNLAIRSRKKKAAPPPPPVIKESIASESTKLSSPIVASQVR